MNIDERNEAAKKIIKYRAANNITRKELSKKLGCSTTTLGSIENRDNSVKEITIAKILVKLGLED